MDSIVPWQPQPNNIYHMDALTLLRHMPYNSVDLIVTDPPYNTTACKWESDIATSDKLWDELWRVSTVIIMTCSEPFTSTITYQQRRYYRHSWVWEKSLATGYLNANRAPMKAHEDVRVFSSGGLTYAPQMTKGDVYRATSGTVGGHVRDKTVGGYLTINNGDRFPRSVQKFDSAKNPEHPTQKPVALFEYLLKTYAKPNALVLDPFMGSGTTAVAAQRLGRQYIGCDISAEYVEIARRRVQNADPYQQTTLDNGLVQKSLFEEVTHG